MLERHQDRDDGSRCDASLRWRCSFFLLLFSMLMCGGMIVVSMSNVRDTLIETSYEAPSESAPPSMAMLLNTSDAIKPETTMPPSVHSKQGQPWALHIEFKVGHSRGASTTGMLGGLSLLGHMRSKMGNVPVILYVPLCSDCLSVFTSGSIARLSSELGIEVRSSSPPACCNMQCSLLESVEGKKNKAFRCSKAWGLGHNVCIGAGMHGSLPNKCEDACAAQLMLAQLRDERGIDMFKFRSSVGDLSRQSKTKRAEAMEKLMYRSPIRENMTKQFLLTLPQCVKCIGSSRAAKHPVTTAVINLVGSALYSAASAWTLLPSMSMRIAGTLQYGSPSTGKRHDNLTSCAHLYVRRGSEGYVIAFSSKILDLLAARHLSCLYVNMVALSARRTPWVSGIFPMLAQRFEPKGIKVVPKSVGVRNIDEMAFASACPLLIIISDDDGSNWSDLPLTKRNLANPILPSYICTHDGPSNKYGRWRGTPAPTKWEEIPPGINMSCKVACPESGGTCVCEKSRCVSESSLLGKFSNWVAFAAAGECDGPVWTTARMSKVAKGFAEIR